MIHATYLFPHLSTVLSKGIHQATLRMRRCASRLVVDYVTDKQPQDIVQGPKPTQRNSLATDFPSGALMPSDKNSRASRAKPS